MEHRKDRRSISACKLFINLIFVFFSWKHCLALLSWLAVTEKHWAYIKLTLIAQRVGIALRFGATPR